MQSQETTSRSGSNMRLLAVAILGGIVTLVGGKLVDRFSQSSTPSAFTTSDLPSQFVSDARTPEGTMDFTVAAAMSTPAVVHVKSSMMVKPQFRGVDYLLFIFHWAKV